MKLGYFVTFYGGILIVLGLAMPMPNGFHVPIGGRDPVGGSPPRCFALIYSQPPSEDFPAHVRLESAIMHRWSLPVPDSIWYRLDAEPSRATSGWWRLAGPDSVDFVAWDHAPLFRIPARGGQGHGIYRGAPSLFVAMIEPPIPVHAFSVPCGESTNSAPGV